MLSSTNCILLVRWNRKYSRYLNRSDLDIFKWIRNDIINYSQIGLFNIYIWSLSSGKVVIPSPFRKFNWGHHEMVDRYGISSLQMIADMFGCRHYNPVPSSWMWPSELTIKYVIMQFQGYLDMFSVCIQ